LRIQVGLAGEIRHSMPMQSTIVVIILDVSLAFATGLLLATRLEAYGSPHHRWWTWLLILMGINCAESFAFSASMATNLLSYGTAILWCLIFARRLRPSEMRLLGLYSCLPAISFIAMLWPLHRAGWGLTGRQEGYRFGIPHIVPWPFCTVLGFVVAVSLSAVLIKMAITVATPAILRRAGHTASEF
jgi:hypothetical protein